MRIDAITIGGNPPHDSNSIDDLADNQPHQIAHFFEHYKDLEEGKWVKIDRWGDAREARGLIIKAIEDGSK